MANIDPKFNFSDTDYPKYVKDEILSLFFFFFFA